jgi:hypothetical protein
MVTFNEADVRQALIQTEGNLSWAAARFAAPRTDLKQYIDATPALQAVIRDLQEDVDDETGLYVLAAQKQGQNAHDWQFILHRFFSIHKCEDKWNEFMTGRIRTSRSFLAQSVKK